MDAITEYLHQVSEETLLSHVVYLAKDPLPCRRLNYTLPGHTQSTLELADAYIRQQLESYGYAVDAEPVPVQAFRRDPAKPLAHQYSPPDPEDPWFEARNLYAKKAGAAHPDDVVVVLAHKDSQSWLECGPGASDNAVGTAAVLEMARVLRDYSPRRAIWFLFCNEEHTPWTSVRAAQNLAQSGLNVVAALNVDSIGGKSAEDHEAGRMTNVTLFTTPEGEALADLMAELNERYGLGLAQRKHQRERPGDDDGSFINAGIAPAVMNLGSCPYADPDYHTEQDTPDKVDVRNVALATQLSLAALLHLDAHGAPGPA